MIVDECWISTWSTIRKGDISGFSTLCSKSLKVLCDAIISDVSTTFSFSSLISFILLVYEVATLVTFSVTVFNISIFR